VNGNDRSTSGYEYLAVNSLERTPPNRAIAPDPPPRNSGIETQSLGEPLSIQEVAAMLGCSPWTVRQKYLPQGLPHLRTSAGGRLVFFRLQVIRWILKRQEIHTKGGVKK